MRLFVRWILSVTFLIAACGPLAIAQSALEQLNQLTQELRFRPADEALRERIVRLGAGIKPPPAIPEEAERRMARGQAAVSGAKTPDDFLRAVSEFEAAATAAPWWGDVYFNLGVVYDKAGRYPQSLTALRLALAASPDSKEARNLFYQVEYRFEKQKQRDQARPPETQLILPGKRVGPIHLGMPLNEVGKILGNFSSNSDPLDSKAASTVHFFDRMTVWGSHGRVTAIGTSRQEHRTEDGLAVGSKYEAHKTTLGAITREDWRGSPVSRIVCHASGQITVMVDPATDNVRSIRIDNRCSEY